MRVCIYGAGAIGGYLAVLLKRAGVEVSAVARGPQLAAVRARGFVLERGGERLAARVPATEDPSDLPPQDFVIATMKAHSMPAAVAAMQPLLGRDTAVVSAVNGLPWWYFHRLDSPFGERPLASVDPDGGVWRGIGPRRAIGCVVYPAAQVVAPGVVRHLSGDKLVLGEPSGERTERVERLARALVDAGVKAPVRTRLRDEVWVKLWGNLAFNPLSALTGATLDALAAGPGTRAVARAMMVEGQAVGEAFGARFAIDVERRIDAAGAVGAHRTSMLQDLELGRPLENQAMVGAVQELARLAGVATPTIDLVHHLLEARIASRPPARGRGAEGRSVPATEAPVASQSEGNDDTVRRGETGGGMGVPDAPQGDGNNGRRQVEALKAYRKAHYVSDREMLPKHVGDLVYNDSFAFLIGAAFDRGMPWTKAWEIPCHIAAEGMLEPRRLAAASDREREQLLARLPVGPRWGAAEGAKTLRDAAELTLEHSAEGDAAAIWRDASPRQAKRRLRTIHGVGPGIADMIVRILHDEWGLFRAQASEIDVKPDIHVVRVFKRLGLVAEGTVRDVVEAARRLNPGFPGGLDWPAWKVGIDWCHASAPDCGRCPLADACPKHIG